MCIATSTRNMLDISDIQVGPPIKRYWLCKGHSLLVSLVKRIKKKMILVTREFSFRVTETGVETHWHIKPPGDHFINTG